MIRRGHEGPDMLQDEAAPAAGQWPAYQVFEQRRTGEPYASAGTVHAADAEMALLTARDVFARRPTCVGLWVTPAAGVYRRTKEQLMATAQRVGPAQEASAQEVMEPGSSKRSFSVFRKTKHAGAHVYAGTVEAHTPSEAIQGLISRLGEALVWWVVPEDDLLRSRPEDVASMFAPAIDKTYRDQASYQTVLRMHQIKLEQEAEGSSDETKEVWSPWSKM